MFCDRRAFRSGESGRLALHFVVACAAAAMLVLHRNRKAMRLDTQVALCVPKGESQRDTHDRKKLVQLSLQEKMSSVRKICLGYAPISLTRQNTYKLSPIEFISPRRV